jgi:hypothetical protein
MNDWEELPEFQIVSNQFKNSFLLNNLRYFLIPSLAPLKTMRQFCRFAVIYWQVFDE